MRFDLRLASEMVRANSIEDTDSPLRASQQIDFTDVGVLNEAGQLCVTQGRVQKYLLCNLVDFSIKV